MLNVHSVFVENILTDWRDNMTPGHIEPHRVVNCFEKEEYKFSLVHVKLKIFQHMPIHFGG